MSEQWDGKVVMSTPGGPIVEMSLGDLLARKDAEIARLRENVDRAGKEAERADRLRAEIARVKADEKKNRAENERLRASLKQFRCSCDPGECVEYGERWASVCEKGEARDVLEARP